MVTETARPGSCSPAPELPGSGFRMSKNRYPDPRRGSRSNVGGPVSRGRPVTSCTPFTGPARACLHLLSRSSLAAPRPRAARGRAPRKGPRKARGEAPGSPQVSGGGARRRPGAGSRRLACGSSQSNRGSNSRERTGEDCAVPAQREAPPRPEGGRSGGEVPGRNLTVRIRTPDRKRTPASGGLPSPGPYRPIDPGRAAGW